jgi:PPOX class probable F420-dependent enzyme
VAIFSNAERAFLDRMRVARLATADAGGQPHVIPIVFAIDDRLLYTPLDRKPKRVAPGQLKRVRNVLVNPRVAVVVDEYDEDWTRLAWVLVAGRAEMVKGGPAHRAGVGLLQAKYRQYDAMRIDEQPLIVVRPVRVTSWGRL